MFIDREKYRRLGIINSLYKDIEQPQIERAFGDKVWRCICVHRLTGEENKGKRNIYFDLVDKFGNFIDKPVQTVGWTWEGRQPHEANQPVKFEKSGDEPRANLPLFKGQTVTVKVLDSIQSDIIDFLTSDLPDETDGNSRFHNSYYIIWQLQESLTVTSPSQVAAMRMYGKLLLERAVNELDVDEVSVVIGKRYPFVQLELCKDARHFAHRTTGFEVAYLLDFDAQISDVLDQADKQFINEFFMRGL